MTTQAQKKHYPAPVQKLEFSKLEEGVLKFWNENKVFEESIKIREVSKEIYGSKHEASEFIFYDGPPFANGLPHYGHLLAGYVKDTVARYQTMRGYKVERRFGWDCHGLPAEMPIEKKLKLNGRKAIEEYGIGKFNEACRKDVQAYVDEWKHYVNRLGRWVDFDGGYKTMDLDYMESVIWVFKQLYDKGLLYEDYKVMPYSWSCQTPLSNFETKQDDSYRQRADKAITVKFELEKKLNGKTVKILAWTTTPWTLPSNLALAVNKDVEYAIIEKDGENLVIAKELLAKYKKELSVDGEKFNAVGKIKGEKLVGLEYKPLFPYLAKLDDTKVCPKCFTVLHADFVTTEDGTGVVHIAPGFGEDDQMLCKKAGIPTVCPVDDAGKFTKIISDYAGMQVFETNDPIIIRLKEEGKWLRTEQYLHDYPHCWRTREPLIYKAMSSWYVRVTAVKEKMLKNNEKINWIPGHVKHGRFGKWLEGARDWAITRNRFWGCPVPVWKSDNPKYPRMDVYGSLDELEKDFGVRPKDLHRPYIDELVRKNPDDPTGKSMMRRVPDILDCWFESGSMPYAQHHYPFEKKDWFDDHFPADFIAEGEGQLRGWFYLLTVLASALFDKPAFTNCISFGTIVDETGKKLSKSLRNYVDPNEAFDKFGSDAIRWLLIKSPVLKGEELRVDKEGRDMKEVLRLAIKPVLNAYNFFCLYANSDKLEAKKITTSDNVMDRYILAKLKSTVQYIRKEMDVYNMGNACRKSEEFFGILNNWYIRRNKNRFWKAKIDIDKKEAYDTLYTVLVTMTEAIASLMPFTSEFIWRGLQAKS